ncbi:MAG TPA: hypothetical protein VKQ70_03570 [Caulobacteraceae bacterium]|jgi:hypothetical protein|nr:hypothetical protein [Caulobacteraceae bacterium]
MATPVRPPVWPPAPSDIKPGRNDVRAAAQKAFFEAALAGRPNPTTAQAARDDGPPRTTAAQAVRSVAATEARATDRLPPPGSLVNILV